MNRDKQAREKAVILDLEDPIGMGERLRTALQRQGLRQKRQGTELYVWRAQGGPEATHPTPADPAQATKAYTPSINATREVEPKKACARLTAQNLLTSSRKAFRFVILNIA